MSVELVADTAGGGSAVTISGPLPLPTDPSDRAGRLVGVVSAASLPLPTGAATEATLAAVSGKLPSALVADRLKVDGSGVTQPVSLAAGVDVTDRAARLVGVVSGAVDVTDRAGRLVGVVSAASLPLPTGAATEATLAAVSGKLPSALVADRLKVDLEASDLSVTVAGAANAIATLTLPAAGAGLFHYITSILICRVATAALAGGAILTVTSTNLPGNPSWRTGNQMSITVASSAPPVLLDKQFTSPLRSSVANTATTIVGPAAGAAVSWHMVVHYYVGP